MGGYCGGESKLGMVDLEDSFQISFRLFSSLRSLVRFCTSNVSRRVQDNATRGSMLEWELKWTMNSAKAICLVESLVRECKNALNVRVPAPLYLQGRMVRFRRTMLTENSPKTTGLSQDANVRQSCNRKQR